MLLLEGGVGVVKKLKWFVIFTGGCQCINWPAQIL